MEVGLLSRLHPLVALLKLMSIITTKYNYIKFTPSLHIYTLNMWSLNANTTFIEQGYNKWSKVI